jgi:hypothetical protein
MAETEATKDWASDVKAYVPDADDAIIAGIVRYCGIALRSKDASLVSFSDPSETERVREKFLKKKLELTDPDELLDAAIGAVGERMRASRNKNRVTVYYLLAERYGKLALFAPKAKAPKATKAKAAPAADDATDMMALSAAGPEPVVAPPPAAPAVPAPVMAPPPPPPPPAPVAPMAMAALPPRTVVAAPVGRAAWAFPLGAVLVFGAIAALIIAGGR